MSQQNYLGDYAEQGYRKHKETSLKSELMSYAEKGVSLSIKGREARPEDIAFVCAVCENDTPYMRDYITDDKGIVRTIDFVNVY